MADMIAVSRFVRQFPAWENWGTMVNCWILMSPVISRHCHLQCTLAAVQNARFSHLALLAFLDLCSAHWWPAGTQCHCLCQHIEKNATLFDSKMSADHKISKSTMSTCNSMLFIIWFVLERLPIIVISDRMWWVNLKILVMTMTCIAICELTDWITLIFFNFNATWGCLLVKAEFWLCA